MIRLLLITTSLLFCFLALNGCHYYVKMMPDITISSQPFPISQLNNLPVSSTPIVVNPGEIHVP